MRGAHLAGSEQREWFMSSSRSAPLGQGLPDLVRTILRTAQSEPTRGGGRAKLATSVFYQSGENEMHLSRLRVKYTSGKVRSP